MTAERLLREHIWKDCTNGKNMRARVCTIAVLTDPPGALWGGLSMSKLGLSSHPLSDAELLRTLATAFRLGSILPSVGNAVGVLLARAGRSMQAARVLVMTSGTYPEEVCWVDELIPKH